MFQTLSLHNANYVAMKLKRAFKEEMPMGKKLHIMQIMCCKTNAVPEWAAAGGGIWFMHMGKNK